MIDDKGLDTKLARLLHAMGRLDLGLLRTCLNETRVARERAPCTLARTLVNRGVLSEAETAAILARLAPPPIARLAPPTQLAHSFGESGPRPALTPEPRHAASESNEALSPVEQWLKDAETNRGDTMAGGAGGVLESGELSAWRPGVRINDFRILDKLGAGGMGMVFLAEDLRTGAKRALKTIAERADPELVARLVREGEALAAVDAHPNVVRVHSRGTAFGRVYLVMEVASGGDLNARVRRAPLAVDEAVRVVRDLARGLAFMHAKGILHRDIKPSNVLFDEHGTPKLVDFGLARIAGADRLTRTGDVVGTPSYMSPEQALGVDVGPATDVYALAGVLYFSLTGETPFEGAGQVELLDSIVNDPPIPLRTRRPELPASIEEICLAGLVKKPEERPSAEELAASLDAFLEFLEHGPGTPVKEPSRAPLVLALGALLSAGVLAGVVAWRWPKAAPTQPDAVATPGTASAPGAPKAVAAVPSAAPAGPRPLALRFAAGDAYRVAVSSSIDYSFTEWQLTWTQFRKFVLAMRVESAGVERVRLAAKVENLEIRSQVVRDPDGPPNPRFDAMLGERGKPFAFDSARVEDAAHPYQRAIGHTFTLELDPRTGEFLAAKGLEDIQQAIDSHPKAQEEQAKMRGMGGRGRSSNDQIFSEPQILSVLNAIHHVLARETSFAGRAWEVGRPGGRTPNDRRPFLDARFSSTDHSGDVVDVVWSGERSEGLKRSVEGKATIARGRVAKSEAVERLSSFREEGRDRMAMSGDGRMLYEYAELR